jgi:hypothetical protein
MASSSRSSTARRTATAKKSPARGKTSGGRVTKKKGSTVKRPKRATKQPAPEDIDDEALEFIAALDDYKKRHDRPFPSWSEVLHVLKSLGYARD